MKQLRLKTTAILSLMLPAVAIGSTSAFVPSDASCSLGNSSQRQSVAQREMIDAINAQSFMDLLLQVDNVVRLKNSGSDSWRETTSYIDIKGAIHNMDRSLPCPFGGSYGFEETLRGRSTWEVKHVLADCKFKSDELLSGYVVENFSFDVGHGFTEMNVLFEYEKSATWVENGSVWTSDMPRRAGGFSTVDTYAFSRLLNGPVMPVRQAIRKGHDVFGPGRGKASAVANYEAKVSWAKHSERTDSVVRVSGSIASPNLEQSLFSSNGRITVGQNVTGSIQVNGFKAPLQCTPKGLLLKANVR